MMVFNNNNNDNNQHPPATSSTRVAAARAVGLLPSLLLLLVLASTSNAASAAAFLAAAPRRCGTTGGSIATRRAMSRPDASEAVEEAKRISLQYGPKSKEARVAWDIVEEMDASDNSAASTSSFAAPSMAKMTDEQLREMDYLNQIRSLDMLLSESKERLSQMKVLASQVKKMELDDPDLAKLGDDDKGLKKALAAARAAADVHGPDSSEARVAWESLEACADELGECPVDGGAPDPTRYSAAALKAHHYYDAVVDSKLLQDAVDAFGAIERLGDYVRLERKRLDGK